MPKALIVIPTYNESDNIQLLISNIFKLFTENVEILVVDDNSPDKTGDKVKSLMKQENRIHLLSRSEKLGLGTAYVKGFQWGLERDFDYFIEMDADFSHNPKYLQPMLELLQSHDVVIGSRYIQEGGVKNWSLIRKGISKFGSMYARLAPINDFTGGFNGWRREVLESISLDSILSGGYLFQIELKYRASLLDYSIKEFPIIFEERRAGKSKMGANILIEAVFKIWKLRLNKTKYLKNHLR
jgi:dolichol-phosphate mannosyltransferase